MYKLLTRRNGERSRFRRFKTKRRTRQEMREKKALLRVCGTTNIEALVEEVVEREAILAQAARRKKAPSARRQAARRTKAQAARPKKKAQSAGPMTPQAAGRKESRPPPPGLLS